MTAARQEWADRWPLPFVAMLGYAGTSCFAYSSGVFMVPMTHAFGWSRTEFSSTFMLQTLLGFILMPLVGQLVDRVGARRVALAGVLPVVLGYYLLSLAAGPIRQWWLLCLGQTLLAAMISPTVWLTAVASQFRVSRGMALATVLTGTGFASAIWPYLAAHYIGWLGWRHAYPALAASWAIIMLPLAYFGFTPDGRGRAVVPRPTGPRTRYAGRLTSRSFLSIAISGGLFSSVSLGMMLHLVPILQEHGFTLGGAAKLAVVAGLFSIIGRIAIGYLLDHLPTMLLAVGVFLLPMVVSVLLLSGGGSAIFAMLAVAILGFSAGAETDIVVYMLSRQFEPDILGSIYGIIMAVFAGCASLGPLMASAIFDLIGSYNVYLMFISLPLLIGIALICTIPQPRGAT